MSIDEIYARHPLREETILRRLVDQGNDIDRLTEWHLALDSDTDITDQNHSGGISSVLELAIAARVSNGTRVADIGAGLGGSARVLAQAFHCRVDAYERDAGRCRDAVSLTRRVQLDDLVTIIAGDVLVNPAPHDTFDVLWGQASWIHFPDMGTFLDLWMPSLRGGGRVVIADAFLRRPPSNQDDADLITNLERAWAGHLLPVQHCVEALRARGAQAIRTRDRTEDAVSSFDRVLRVSSRWHPGSVTSAEQESWALARAAFERELVENRQVVAFF